MVAGIILVALYQVPAIHDRAYFYVASLRSKIYYFFKPPQESAFVPSTESTLDLGAISSSPTPTLTQAPSQATPMTAEQAAPATATPEPTLEPTPLPASVQLQGVIQEYQRFNSCGPANLALAMRYWGWVGDQLDIEKVVKPRLEDRNVTIPEMLVYVQNETSLTGQIRYNGTVSLLKKFIAAGFPVLIERGYVNRDDGWMGHYGVVDGYDDSVVMGGQYDNVLGTPGYAGAVHIPDTFNGEVWVTYDSLQSYWDEFFGTYMVVYPPEREAEVLAILGPDADAAVNLENTIAAITGRLETVEKSEKYFTLYSLGELLVMKKDYANAAAAFDEAFSVYGFLPVDDRPWRMLWYQVGPYEAYYNMGRYEDVVSLAYKTITDTPQPALPETFLWSGRANVALGNTSTAIFDFQRALQWHPNWPPAVEELKALGVDPQS